jgi:hypothetical protein
MRVAGLICALLLVVGGLQAAPPVEPVVTRLEGVDPASRQIVADGMTWALSSTAVVGVPGQKRASLRDLRPGMNVRLALVPADGEVPVVSSITVLPD